MKYVTIGFLFLCILYVHFRGKVRQPFMRQLFDHSSFMAPINLFMQLFSRVPARPFLDVGTWKDLVPLQENWQIIRAEAMNLLALQKIKASELNNDAGFNSFFKSGWRRFYLKWYAADHPSAERLCPQTVTLLRNIPSIKAAMFAELPPGAKLNPHRDPYAGSLRYHLGLATPNDERCFIEVDGQRHSWRDGQSVIFDETYIHWAVNGTETSRVILFCDIERPMRFRWAQAFNGWLGHTLVTAASSPNEPGDQIGLISKMFTISYMMGRYRRRYKTWNKTAYRVTKAALILSVVGLIIWL